MPNIRTYNRISCTGSASILRPSLTWSGIFLYLIQLVIYLYDPTDILITKWQPLQKEKSSVRHKKKRPHCKLQYDPVKTPSRNIFMLVQNQPSFFYDSSLYSQVRLYLYSTDLVSLYSIILRRVTFEKMVQTFSGKVLSDTQRFQFVLWFIFDRSSPETEPETPIDEPSRRLVGSVEDIVSIVFFIAFISNFSTLLYYWSSYHLPPVLGGNWVVTILRQWQPCKNPFSKHLHVGAKPTYICYSPRRSLAIHLSAADHQFKCTGLVLA